MVQVCLVQMPYSAIERPSVALGLLKACLIQRSIPTRVVHANLDFAAAIGLDVFRAGSESSASRLIGEWMFAKAAFPDGTPDEDLFLASVAGTLAQESAFATLRRLHPGLDCARLVKEVRQYAPEFVDATAKRVLALEPKIVGCTSTFQQHCASLALLRRIKALSPDTVTMIGGANCEGAMGEATHRHFPWIDFVMSGEVDAFFAEFCELILDKGIDAAARQAPEGVFGPRERRGSNYRLVPPRALLHSMDQAAVPDYDDYFDALRASPFRDSLSPCVGYESSRGCWWGMKHHCTFCGLNGEGMVYRAKSAPRVVDEILTLARKYNLQWLESTDNILDLKYLETMLPTLVDIEDHPFLFYEVKANLRRDQLRLLSRAGVRRVQPGIENLHDDVLALLDKGNRWFTNVQMMKWALEYGIYITWNLLAGVPGERDEWYADLAKWLPLIYHLAPPDEGVLQCVRYDRFSVYHSEPQKYDLDLAPDSSYARVYPLENDALTNLAYYFEDRGPNPNWHLNRGPGHRAVAKCLHTWLSVFVGGDGTAMLSGNDQDGRLVIRDTRPLAVAETQVFEGLERAILQECDAARTPSGLLQALQARGHQESAERVRASIDDLKARYLLLEQGQHILSLHVNEPIMPYAGTRPPLVRIAALLKRLGPSRFVLRAMPDLVDRDEWHEFAVEAY